MPSIGRYYYNSRSINILVPFSDVVMKERVESRYVTAYYKRTITEVLLMVVDGQGSTSPNTQGVDT